MSVVLLVRERVFRNRVRLSVFRRRRVSRRRFRGMNRATELIASHHVTEREKDATQEHNAEKKSYEMPALQHSFATTAASIARHRLYVPVYLPASFIHCEIISTGSGKTMVVFFSTPISVKVCK